MKPTYPLARHLVLIGGGHSHVIFLRMLGMSPIPGLAVTLVSPGTHTPYSGMLPGLIAGHYDRDEVYIDLVPLCRFAGADFVRGHATGLNLIDQQVQVEGRPGMGYDLVSIDIGSTPSLVDLAAGDVTPVKPISALLGRWESVYERVVTGEVTALGVVGAGAGGVELTLAIDQYLKANNHDIPMHIFSDRKTVLPGYPASVRVVFEKIVNERSIEVHRDFRAHRYESGVLSATDGRSLALDEVFWVTQAGAQGWPGEAGLAVNDEGFIQVTDTLQSISHHNVFAVGDCAIMESHPRPRAGVFAVRQGKPLYQNIKAYVLGRQLKAHVPQKEFLSLITTGPQHAVASRNGVQVNGDWVWRWKNWIDQRFMARFRELPVMKVDQVNELQAEFDAQMHCGGCGSKVSADLLRETLVELLGEAAAPADDAVSIEVPEGKLLLQTVDHFRSLLNDPYLQARIAVCHAFSDVYACGGRASSALAMLTLPFAKPGVTRAMLRQILAGACDQLRDEGADLSGGHTSEGLELSIGFAANGLVERNRRWYKHGLEVGQCLVLTKPLGTGTILAADMQHQGRGEWLEAAVATMLQSNRDAVNVLHGFDVTSCTDVTGFGLAGHLNEMIKGDTLGIALDGDAIPLIEGAAECMVGKEITSTLHAANQQAVAVMGVKDMRDEIIFDPQTSGGLVAAVAEEKADKCVEALRSAGYCEATVIGRVIDGRGIQVIRET